MRLNLEDRFFSDPNVKWLSKIMSWSMHETYGCLVVLWYFSQKQLKIFATEEEIFLWCDIKQTDECKIIEALIKTNFIKKSEENLFRIAGNLEQIENIKKFKRRAKAGGLSKAAKYKDNCLDAQHLATSMLEADLKHASSMPITSTITSTITNTIPNTNTKANTERERGEGECEGTTCEPEGSPISSDCFSQHLPVKKELHVLAKVWNEHCGKLKKCLSTSGGRGKHCSARFKENNDLSYWVTVVEKLSESSFCQGNNDRGWQASFDFFIKPDTHLKAMEGKYDNKPFQHSNKYMTISEHNIDQAERVLRGEL